MNFDKRLMFCEEQAITAAAESQNTIELGDNDVTIGTPVPLFIFVNEAFAGGTSLKIEVQVNDAADFSGTTKTLLEETIAVADLKADAVLPPKFMPKGAKGYARLKFTPTGTFTAGQITAGVVDAIHEDYTDL
jgi:hypothetical protein